MSPRNCKCPGDDTKWLDLCDSERLHAQAAKDHVERHKDTQHTATYLALAASA